MRVEELKWNRTDQKVEEMEKWTKMDDVDTRSARLAVFFQKAQSHSCK